MLFMTLLLKRNFHDHLTHACSQLFNLGKKCVNMYIIYIHVYMYNLYLQQIETINRFLCSMKFTKFAENRDYTTTFSLSSYNHNFNNSEKIQYHLTHVSWFNLSVRVSKQPTKFKKNPIPFNLSVRVSKTPTKTGFRLNRTIRKTG